MNAIFVIKVLNTLLILFLIVILAKVEVSFWHQQRIMDAICRYNRDFITRDLDAYLHGGYIPYETVEPFKNTVFRLWDWGYMRIVDKETLKKIKPYM